MPDQRTASAVAAFDVNETLSNLDGLASRLEVAGGDPGVLPLWFAATLRDGFGLTAAGAYADFAEIAVPSRRSPRRRPGFRRGAGRAPPGPRDRRMPAGCASSRPAARLSVNRSCIMLVASGCPMADEPFRVSSQARILTRCFDCGVAPEIDHLPRDAGPPAASTPAPPGGGSEQDRHQPVAVVGPPVILDDDDLVVSMVTGPSRLRAGNYGRG
jgi:hypothetical protein